MWSWIALGVGGLLLSVVTLWVLLLVSLRTKFSPVLTAIRRLNRVVWNPRAMKAAGRPGAYASVIRHTGRITGTQYETPVGAVRTEDGFVIALPYGTSSDWLKNLLAARSAVIVDEGETFRVDAPELVSVTSANRHFSPKEQRIHRLYGVDLCLSVRRFGLDVPVGNHL